MITGVHTNTMVLESQKRPEAASKFTDQYSKVASVYVPVTNSFLLNLKVLADLLEAALNSRYATCINLIVQQEVVVLLTAELLQNGEFSLPCRLSSIQALGLPMI